jgi:triacylglycerol lipase
MKTKYPILLVHGIAIKDWKFIKCFGNIKKVLNQAGFDVETSKTDGFGTIENNAKQLKKQIEDILLKYNTDKINIIAHSKGGLDSKYLIKELGMEEHVASLTTLCTPHKGSKIANKILTLPKWIIKILEFWINLIYKIFKDENPNCLEVAKQLKSINKIEDETYNFSDIVYCQSYSTTLKRSRDDFIMGRPLIFSKKYEKDKSDGLVSNKSSEFGEYKGDCLEESISHSEIVGYSLSKKKRKRIEEFYIKLCNELTELGF